MCVTTLSFTKGVTSLDVNEDNDDTLVYVYDNCDGKYIDIGYEK